jgi:oligopeptidase B
MSEQAPVAARRPVQRRHHDDTFVDDYEWLRGRGDPEVLAHLTVENDWCNAQTEHLKPMVDELVTYVEDRTRETDLSVPQLVHHDVNGARVTFWYYSRTVEGSPYPLLCRLPVTTEVTPDIFGDLEEEQVMLDGNVEAEGHAFFALGAFRVSPDGRLLAWAVDFNGDERHALHIRDLATGTYVDDPMPNVGRHLAWAGTTHLFYTRFDGTRRPHQLVRHRLGTTSDEDVVVVAEKDEQFWLSADESRDRRWIVVTSGSKRTSETQLLSIHEPEGRFRVVAPRRHGIKYKVEVAGDRLLVLHNDNGCDDFELAQAPLEATAADQWKPLLRHQSGVRLLRADAYVGHVVVSLRRDALTSLHIIPRTATGEYGTGEDVRFDDELHTVSASRGPNYDDTSIRLHLMSFLAPPSVHNYDVAARKMTVLKQTKVLDGEGYRPYDPADYVQRREWATAEDGTRIPISVVHARETPRDGTAPAILYGYGAYETSLDPTFSAMLIALLEKGFVYAIAHVRGGGELGRDWYEGGRRLHKKNSFTDFVACAQHLISSGYTTADRLAAQGASAGGLLVGAAVNLAPETFRAVHATVPFVDALTTMLDPDLPLTVSEWEEWGNPVEDPEVYACMKGYSPYENVAAARYPAFLVTASLNDTRVSFTEPAKWVAALRATTTNGPDRPILLKTEMVAGHGGVTGRYNQWEQTAFEFAWLVDQLATG